MNTCVINGKRYDLPENASVSVNNGKVYVNGKPFVDSKDFKEKTINITIEGNVGSIEATTGSVLVKGNSETIKTGSGNVTVNGDVRCNAIYGNANTVSGDVSNRGTNIFNSLKKHFEPLISKRSEFD